MDGITDAMDMSLSKLWKMVKDRGAWHAVLHGVAKSQVFTKILMLGNNKSRRRRERQKTRLLDGITDSMDMSLSKLWKMVKDRDAWRAALHGAAKNRTQLSD